MFNMGKFRVKYLSFASSHSDSTSSHYCIDRRCYEMLLRMLVILLLFYQLRRVLRNAITNASNPAPP